MVNAFVLINIEGKNVRETAERLIAVDGVTERVSIDDVFSFADGNHLFTIPFGPFRQ